MKKKKKTAVRKPANDFSIFKFYELSVQSPEWQADYLPQFHKWLTGKKLRKMREDFCGTGLISCEWVKRSKSHYAVGLDLNPRELAYAESVNKAALSLEQRKRVEFRCQNVLKPTRDKFDSIGAYNFSFYIFLDRKSLLKYARAAYASLEKSGTFFLEMSGGPGLLETDYEERKIPIPKDLREQLGGKSFTQAWEQFHYDPVTAISDFSIHFKLPNGKKVNDAFTYHWRIWQIAEVREILEEAGFKRTVVLWEQLNRKGDGTGEFLPVDNAEHIHAYLAYVVGVK